MILCLSNNDDTADDFELEIVSSSPVDIKPNSNLLEELKYKQEVAGQWHAESCGGSISERTFTKNDFYLVTVSQPNTSLFVQIESRVSSPVGMYVFKTDKTSLNELDQAEIDRGVSTTMFVMKHNSLYYDCDKHVGNFIMVPCSYNKVEGEYNLKVSASKQISMKPGVNKSFPVRKDYQITTVSPSQLLNAGHQNMVTL